MTAQYPIPSEERQRLEAILLGSLFQHPEKGSVIKGMLQSEDFSEERHRLIYEALLTISGIPERDIMGAVCTLLTPDELERIGGVATFTALKRQAEDVILPIEEQANLLKQTTLHRVLTCVGEVLSTHADQFDTDHLKQLIGDLEHTLAVAQQLLFPKDVLPPPFPLQSDVDTYLGELGARRRQQTTFTGVPTGFADLDTITGGLQPSHLIIVAGPPSIGKTSFALSIALHVLFNAHRSVGLFSLEAPKRGVIERLLSMGADLDQRLLRSLKMDDEEWRRLGEVSAALSGAKLLIDDTPSLSMTQLYDKARLLVEQNGIELLIIDYVHLLSSSMYSKRYENRAQEMGEISRCLKVLARDLNIPVLALAQVSRAFESRPSKKLQLSDLRDGSLENDADLVLFLSLAEADTMTVGKAAPRLTTLSIAKHRNGPRTDLNICFHPSSVRFHDLRKPSLQQSSPLSTPPRQSPRQLPSLPEQPLPITVGARLTTYRHSFPKKPDTRAGGD